MVQKKKLNPNQAFFNNLLLFLFLLLLPTQLGKHFFFHFSYLSGVRVDYLAPTFYMTDVIVVLLALVNLRLILSMFKSGYIQILSLLLIFNLLISISKPITFYRDLKLIEFLIVCMIMKTSTLSAKKILLACTIGVSVEVVLVLFQFIEKRSLQGIFYFLGERYLTLSTPGAAKASLQGIEILRPYGTFSHPNSMGGFYLLLFFLILTAFRSRTFFWLKNIFLFLSTLVILLSFSKLAIGIFVILNLLYIFKKVSIKKCKICVISRIIVLFVVAAIFFQAQGDPMSLKNRIGLIQNSFQIIYEYFLFGVGFGNYLIAQDVLRTYMTPLLNQPVHTIPLLFLTEFGIPGSVILFLLILQVIKLLILKSPLIVLLIMSTSLLDHYWYTLQQNMLLVGVVVGLSLRLVSKTSRGAF